MLALWIIVTIIIVCFGGVLIFGAPYLPTLKSQISQALDLAELKPGDTMLELGSGDGRVALAAAKRGYRVVGYELNPLLIIFSRLVTWRYRGLVTIHWTNFIMADWPAADAIFIFGLGRIMPKLEAKIAKTPKKPVKLVSVAFTIENRTPVKARGGVFVYNFS